MRSTFKIRNGEGRYSTGGARPAFVQGGKVWSTLGHLKAHLTQYRDEGGWRRQLRDIPEDWEVVEFKEAGVVGQARAIHAQKGRTK